MQQNTTYHKSNVIYSYMDEPRTYHTKWSNLDRKNKYQKQNIKYHMISFICGI